MTDKIIVVENIVNKRYQDFLESVFLSDTFPVYFKPDTLGVDYNPADVFIDKNTVDTPQFVHNFVKNHSSSSPEANYIFAIFTEMCEHLKSNYSLYRCKLNLNYQHPAFDGTTYYAPHKDSSDPFMITGIYYLTDSDGDTIFFDDNKNIIKRVSPKKGSLVYFNSNIFHAGQSPVKHSIRAVINFMLLPRK